MKRSDYLSDTMDDLLRQAQTGRLNRRALLRRGVALGLSAPAIAALLAACGGDDEKKTTPAPQPTTAAPAPTTAPSGGGLSLIHI